LLIYLVSKKDKDSAYALATTLVERAKQINKRHFDNLNALIYFYYARTRELNGEILEIRDELYNAYRTSCLRHDEIGQATILNLLLRNYLHFNHYEAA
jgi:26S proteasome regulatory subunit N3